jgi:hypothetical protein
MEKKVENEFKKYKRRYIAKLGNYALDTTIIDLSAKDLFGSKYKSSYAVDAVFPFVPGYYIINTDVTTGPGIHWIALVLTKKTAYIYDSFARSPTVINSLTKKLIKHGFKIVSSDRSDKEQRMTNRGELVVICGHACLAWLTIVKLYGIRKAIKI